MFEVGKTYRNTRTKEVYECQWIDFSFALLKYKHKPLAAPFLVHNNNFVNNYEEYTEPVVKKLWANVYHHAISSYYTKKSSALEIGTPLNTLGTIELTITDNRLTEVKLVERANGS